MKRNDKHHLTDSPRPTRLKQPPQWEERETIPPPFSLWGSFLLILVSLLAWGVFTG